MKTFPKPLSIQEEREYLKRYKEGDLEAREVLINRNLRLVAHVIKKYQQTGYDMDDLLSVGTIGLIKAVNTYNPQKGKRLVTYASKCIENELLMMLRGEKKKNREVSLNEPIGMDKEGNTISLMDIMENDGIDALKQMENAEDVVRVRQYVEKVLSKREREIIVMRYGLGGEEAMTQKAVGKAMNISRSYVSRIEKKALEKLKKAFDNSYLM